MKTVWLCGALSLAVSVAGVAHAEEPTGESGDPHVAALETEAPTERRSTGLLAGGIVLVSLGSLSSLFGAAFLATQGGREATCERSSQIVVETVGGAPYDCEPDAGSAIAAAGMIAGGLAVVGGGIPMIVIGNQRVPSPMATVSFTPRMSGASVGLNVSF